VNLNFKNE
jgi:hypothetical protein